MISSLCSALFIFVTGLHSHLSFSNPLPVCCPGHQLFGTATAMYRSLSLLALILGLVEALPTNSGNLSSPTASNPSNVIATEPFPTATGPTCIQTRSPSDPSASDINEAITNDISIKKACDIASQSTTTLNNGLLSVIYYGLDNAYFFNSSHRYSEVNAQVVSPSFCPDTFNNIFSTCVTKGNFWGGWVLNDGTNHSSKKNPFAVLCL